MKAAVHFNADCLDATQHLRHCLTQSADTAESDYKLFYDRLQKMSSPQQTMSIVHDHLQSRFLHNVQCWNNLRIAMTVSQHTLMQRFQVNTPVAANQKGKNDTQETYSDPFFMGAMSSAFTHMAEMAQDTMVSELEREIDDVRPNKASSAKSTKSSANHHADGRA